MKKVLILLLLFNYGYSQDISYIKTLDTIYVKFKEDKLQTRFVFPDDYKGFKERRYTINFSDDEKKEFFKFFFTEYLNSEKREKGIKAEIKIVKKAFLKKHKEEIIGIDFFQKYGIIKSTYEAFEKCKVIYLIDMNEKKKGKINLYEVTKWSSYHMGE
ncbi:hypothetical protein C8C83_4018 [Flavobacterium sp. 90]|uniref:hypothetical protein n=1 Tax=unclassified Flavobacterium TaxID=196869 RepID=UPI000EACACB5|nr:MULTISPECIES: hypothetical protein [unclassified Flavobacterium]RKR04685.1 hypothetical protein C8C82_4349 [Flavobacterium sp. 81]TCK56009.1 hypothetical protein C8C83_4018 [Flavobacterium sp. 90]